MSATRYKRQHVDTFICIENWGTKKKTNTRYYRHYKNNEQYSPGYMEYYCKEEPKQSQLTFEESNEKLPVCHRLESFVG